MASGGSLKTVNSPFGLKLIRTELTHLPVKAGKNGFLEARVIELKFFSMAEIGLSTFPKLVRATRESVQLCGPEESKTNLRILYSQSWLAGWAGSELIWREQRRTLTRVRLQPQPRLSAEF